MEDVVVQSQLLHYSDSELLVEMRMLNGAKTEIKALMWSSFVHFNLIEQRREIHTSEFTALFSSVVHPVDEKSFEDRVKAIKTKSVLV